MSLPHFDIITFPGQIFWVFITTGASYLFNKFFFLPYVSNAIRKRQELIANYMQEIEKMSENAKSLKIEMATLSEKARNESKAIIESAIYNAQALLNESVKNNNETIHSQATDYQNYIIEQKEALKDDLPSIISDIKAKLQLFISSQNN
jgi:F-type H+-transporting ATPase subunit b